MWPRARRDRQAGHDGARERPCRHRFRQRRSACAAPVLRRSLRPFVHPRRAPHPRLGVLLVGDPALLRALVRPAWRDLAPANRGRRGGDRDRARGQRASLRARAPVRSHLGGRGRRVPPGRLEVRGLHKRPAAGERDVSLLDRREPRLRPRPGDRDAARPLAGTARRAPARGSVPRRRGVAGRRRPLPRELRSRADRGSKPGG